MIVYEVIYVTWSRVSFAVLSQLDYKFWQLYIRLFLEIEKLDNAVEIKDMVSITSKGFESD